MKICIFGAGAVGGYLAARLLKAGHHTVSLVARGEQLDAIRTSGLRLLAEQEDFTVRPAAVTDRAGDLPPQDLVITTLKAHSQPAVARDIGALLGDTGCAMFANNGIPWWWEFRGAGSPGAPVPLLDPDGQLWREVGPQRVLGCVIYSANEVVEPGVVRHTANNRWVLGEPDGSHSGRLEAACDLLRAAGVNAQASDDIRRWIWSKLLRNAPLNSVCALTRLPINGLAGEPALIELCSAVVDEVAAVAASHGVDVSDQVGAAKAAPRLGGAADGASALGIRPSMLQDVEQGRPMEIEAIVGQVQALGRATGTPTPSLDLLVPLLRGLDRRRAQR
ncbi:MULTISPECIES: ketopantoate reductase family protein [Ramlibacter]|uniref:2-dehydropantoate 2-reductase n=1 Tax=Ramlibacter pinisoli TaxID=2682844 RepID=A0A6N8IRV7_9BURK|nr:MULTISPECIES: 2-dehydropantoate 2-reductase [Ramlibacter]MBA2964329.1 2-dehydropantoate 2-reductase [Ramlibacter sp. CGMCC 1.13660]MVQ29295.1 2-dehydropantoate 2-reductase [Ramlibacter pinisoli]